MSIKEKNQQKHNVILDDPIIVGKVRTPIKDWYYHLLQTSWESLFMAIFAVYILSNIVFALLYMSIPNALIGIETLSFSQAFFFSVQTMSTIGYGALSPQGQEANLIVTIEAAYGIIGTALVTGLVFHKISKPVAKIRFSKNCLISNFDGIQTLTFRMGNTRGNDIVEAKVAVSALMLETTREGQSIRKVHDLKLRRAQTPFFKLTWSLFHEIDETSPIHNFNTEDTNLLAIAITVTGHDGTFSNTVYSRHVYYPHEIVRDRYFEDIMHSTPDGRTKIDYTNFDNFKA